MARTVETTFEVNGTSRTVSVEPRATLLDALRDACHLTGNRAGCEEGVCGACTVLLDGDPVRACTLFAVQAHGREVRTVESLAASGTLHPLQRAFNECHAVQCGACTPGFLMLAAGAFARDPHMDDAALAELATTNLCRCGAGPAIVRALKAARSAMRAAP